MLAALGHYIQCPLKPETVLVGDGVVKLDPVPSTLSVLTDVRMNQDFIYTCKRYSVLITI